MRILMLLPAGILLTCTGVKAQSNDASPHAIVYKTQKDYTKYVAVELSADKKSVVSFPDPADMAGVVMLKPVKLHKGYWLSKAGISANTAYLNMTTAEYGKLKQPPTAEELYKMIRNKKAVKEICDCGVRSAITEKEINALIDGKQLKNKCKKLK